MRRLLFGLMLVSCGRGSSGSDPPPVATNASAIASRDAAAASDPLALPIDASTRLDLSALPDPLPASILVTETAKATTSTQLLRDADGLAYKGAIVEITGSGPALRLTSGAELDVTPTTAAAELSANKAKTHPEESYRSLTAERGTWVVIYRQQDGSCRVTGWAPTAHVSCASQGNLPCPEADKALMTCLTVQPAGTRTEPVGDAALTFPRVTDPKAVDVLAATARAIVRNDRDAIAATVGPGGVLLKGKKVSRAGLKKLLATDTVQRAFEIDCKVPAGRAGPACAWMTDGVADAEIDVIPHELGDDVTPRITFARAADGAWWLAKVDLLDPRAGH